MILISGLVLGLFVLVCSAGVWRYRQLYTRMHASMLRTARALRGSGVAVWEWHIGGKSHYDPSFFCLLGIDAAKCRSQSPLELLVQLVHPVDRSEFISQFNKHTEQSIHHQLRLEFRVVKPQMHCVWMELRAEVLHDAGGLFISGTLGEIEQGRSLQLNAHEKKSPNFIDTLTNLPNRYYLLSKADDLINPGTPQVYAALCLLKIDDFEDAKHRHGHASAEMIVKIVSLRLKQILRQNDVIVRLGGEEFCVVLAHTHKEQAAEVCQKLLAGMKEPLSVDEQRLSVRLNIGVALMPQDGGDYITLLCKADMAMHAAKRAGSGYDFYHPLMEKERPLAVSAG